MIYRFIARAMLALATLTVAVQPIAVSAQDTLARSLASQARTQADKAVAVLQNQGSPNDKTLFAAAARAAGIAIAQSEKLRTLTLAAERLNASDAPAMASPPAITTSSTATSGLAVTLRPAAAMWNGKPLFAMYGGTPVVNVSGWKSASTSVPNNGTISATRNGGGYRVAVVADSTSIDFEFNGNVGSAYRVLVNGVYVSKLPTIQSSAGPVFLNLAFASREDRRIDIEVDATVTFNGVRCSVLDAVQRVPTANRYRIAVFANSYGMSVGSTLFHEGALQHAGRRLGNMDVDIVSMSIGGTDYAATNNGASWDFASHINDINLAPAEDGSGFDEVWFWAGINDASLLAGGGTTLATIQARAQAAWSGVRAAGFKGPISIFGPQVKTLSQSQTVEDALIAQFATWNDPDATYYPTTRGSSIPQSGAAFAAKGTGSVTGSAFTVASTTAGAWAVGQYLLNPGLPMGTTIASGSGTSWVLSQAVPSPIATTTFGGVLPAGGNFALYGGGTTGQDDTHLSRYGHGHYGAWLASARKSRAP
jgi:hypothetical protein